jgi:hypothetical protein
MSKVYTDNWARGSNNIAPSDRLPENTVRSAVNVDPTPGGKFLLRAGFEAVYQGTAPRAILGMGDKLLIADGTDLVEFDTTTFSSKVLRTIAGAGQMVGDEHAGVLYLCTANECLEYNGSTVRQWGVPDVLVQPSIVSTTGGSLLEGHYNVAATYTDTDGREGGTDRPLVVFAQAGGALVINVPQPPAGGKTNIYAGSVNGGTLYWQGEYAAATTVTVGGVRDDTQRLDTVLLRAPTPGSIVTSHNGVLLLAQGKTLVSTAPMRPHLVDRVRGFFQFPAEINNVMSAGGVFVSADKSYLLTNVETDAPQQRIVLEFPAIRGTAVRLPDGRSAWMTKYGQAITNGDNLDLVNRQDYTVGDRDNGAAGVVESNGNQMIVTSTRGGEGPGGLAATDYFFGEILNP